MPAAPVAVTVPEAVRAALPQNVPLPDDVKIVLPGSDVPAELAKFSGIWTGRWEGSLDHVFVVERLYPDKADVVYAVGAHASWGIKAHWTRLTMAFDHGKLKAISGPASLAYWFGPNGLEGLYQVRGSSYPGYFTKAQ